MLGFIIHLTLSVVYLLPLLRSCLLDSNKSVSVVSFKWHLTVFGKSKIKYLVGNEKGSPWGCCLILKLKICEFFSNICSFSLWNSSVFIEVSDLQHPDNFFVFVDIKLCVKSRIINKIRRFPNHPELFFPSE